MSHEMLTRGQYKEIKDAPVNFALENELILSNVLSFLPLKDLKEARKVNHLWKEECQKALRLCGLVTIDFENMLQKFQMGVGFDNFLETVKCQPNFKIIQASTPPGLYFPLRYTANADHFKSFKGNILGFISSNAPTIRSLTLQLSQNQRTDFRFMAKVIKSVPQLRELNLHLELQRGAFSKENWMGEFAVLEPLVSLKKFILKISGPNLKDQDIPKVEELVRKLHQLTPKISALELQYSASLDKIYLRELKELQLVWKIKSIRPQPFQNLSSLNIHLKHVEELLELLQPIRKLEISAAQQDMKEHSLQILLEKHAGTLETFTFNYTPFYSPAVYGGRRLVLPVQCIDFPNLPRLQSLEFNVTIDIPPDLHIWRYVNGMGKPDVFNLLKSFMRGGKKFREKFPQLQSFTWKMPSEEFNPWIYEKVLPKPIVKKNVFFSMHFPQFTTVNLSWPHSHERYCNIQKHNKWMIWLSKLFPNVNNPEFNMARLLK